MDVATERPPTLRGSSATVGPDFANAAATANRSSLAATIDNVSKIGYPRVRAIPANARGLACGSYSSELPTTRRPASRPVTAGLHPTPFEPCRGMLHRPQKRTTKICACYVNGRARILARPLLPVIGSEAVSLYHRRWHRTLDRALRF